MAIGLVLAALTSCGTNGTAASGREAPTPIDASYSVSEYGVMVGIRVSYEERRKVTAARLVTGKGSVDATLYPLDADDPDAPPKSVSLAAGKRVLVEGTLLASCAVDPDTPVFEVDSRIGGTRQTDRFIPNDPDLYQAAVTKWCERGITMNVTGSSATPEGVYKLIVEFSNPGTASVTVTSDRVDNGSSYWRKASVVVPGGTIGNMTIHGKGPPECSATPPWETGHVRADGQVIRPDSADGWC